MCFCLKDFMMFKITSFFNNIPWHNLKGQNLLRFNAINRIAVDCGFFVLSDSATLLKVIGMLFLSRKKLIFYPLELYSISYMALFSEYHNRIFKTDNNISLKAWDLVGFHYRLIKILLFKIIFSNKNIFILPSELRKKFLLSRGFKNPMVVVRNKPIISEFSNDLCRHNDRIVLIGNLNNRNDFLKIQSSSSEFGLVIYCYGISRADHDWIRRQKFSNVIVDNLVDFSKIPSILLAAKYSICLYNNHSINQNLSASSKVYEILFFGAIPIISDNPGLVSELTLLNCNFIFADNAFISLADCGINHNLIRSAILNFANEAQNFKLFLNNF